MMRRLLILWAILLLAQPACASWTYVANRGTATEKTSDTSISVNPSATLDVGDIIFVFCVADNVSAGPDTNHHTVSDSQSNPWTKIGETSPNLGPGSGVTVSLWVSKLTTQLATTDTITLTVSSAVTAKAISVEEFTVAAGKTYSLVGADQNEGSGTGPTAAVSGLSSAEYLLIGMPGWEGTTADVSTFDADYTTFGTTGTSGGGATSNVAMWPGRRVATLTSDTFAVTLGAARDWADVLGAIQEVDEGAPPPVEPPLRRRVITRHSTPGLPVGK